jgi:hypothetical protein
MRPVRDVALTSALIKAGYRKCIYVFFRSEASYTRYVGWHRLVGIGSCVVWEKP